MTRSIDTMSFRTVLSLVLVLTVTTIARAQSGDLPASEPGRCAADFLAALADGSDDALIVFETRWRADDWPETMAARIERWRLLRRMIGAVSVRGHESFVDEISGVREVSVLARVETGSTWCRLRFFMAPPPQSTLQRILLEPADAPPAPVITWTSLDDLATQARTMLDAPAFGLAIAMPGAILGRTMVGTRRLGSDTPAQVEDRFPIGALTQAMTASVTARLVEAGALRWDEVPARRTDEPRPSTAGRAASLTIDDLLRTSVARPATPSDRPLPPRGERRRFARAVLAAADTGAPAPGAPTMPGAVLLASAAEDATDAAWETLVERELTTPLGLKAVSYDLTGDAHLSGHRTRPDGAAAFDAPATPIAERGASGLAADLDDLIRFGGAHLAGLGGRDGWLAPATLARLHPSTPDAPPVGGWRVETMTDGTVQHWAESSEGGITTAIVLVPERRRVIVLVANTQSPDAAGVFRTIVASILSR